MTAIYKPTPWKVEQLIGGVGQGTISLPDLQRPFVWPAAKVRDLFDSMYRGYPVGELMFWDVADDEGSRAIGQGTMRAQHQIIDGQQRLTSLYTAIKGEPIRDSNYRSKRMRIAFNPYTERFEVWTPAIEKSAQWISDISVFFASSHAQERQFKKRLAKAENREISESEEDELSERFQRLSDLLKYEFQVIHIQQDVEKRLVADVFVRINSEGVNLKAYDFILTWLSVFWPDGREQIEEFARLSRVTPEYASEIAGRPVSWTPRNAFINVEPGHLVRSIVALGQNRAKLTDAYSALQAKDRSSGEVDAAKQEQELGKLKRALPQVTDATNWTEFIRTIQTAGFRSRHGITSTINLVYTYTVFLLGRIRYRVDLPILRQLMARWLYMSQLTSRYTASGETQMQQDLDRFARLAEGDASGFVGICERVLATTLTEDFWKVSVPEALVTSGPAMSPAYQCYLAALNTLDAEMFLLNSPRVREWMDPSLPAKKGMEGHHLFPRKYQEKVLGITDLKRINQAANFAPTDWDTNIEISDRAPSEYWPQLLASRNITGASLERQMYWHALPADWHLMDYDDFLAQRRGLIAKVIRDGYLEIGKIGEPTAAVSSPQPEATETTSLQTLLENSLLLPNDWLDPVDPNWVVDAVVSDDGNVVIDGIHAFDSLDDAAASLGVTNMDGLDFWALETEGGLLPLRELAASGRP
jgi:hypothetical protein